MIYYAFIVNDKNQLFYKGLLYARRVILMKCSRSGWFCQEDNMCNITQNITEDDIIDLIHLAEKEDKWSEQVDEEARYLTKKPQGGLDNFFHQEIAVRNTSGAIISYPYGDIITFRSKRHFFRGENKLYTQSYPSLRRKICGLSPREQELHKSVANMRIQQFCKFLRSLHIIPYWEAKISDVNYLALAQHYGFETFLLDLTNDFRTALFFATCQYDKDTDSYHPLTQSEINMNEESHYGVVFHSPNWQLDAMQTSGIIQLYLNLEKRMNGTIGTIDSGDWDGIAFQIGYQPLLRCHSQSGYIYPMRNKISLQEDKRFEKLYFKQSPDLSKRVFDMMDGGKKVFPNEGISKAFHILCAMKEATTFSEDDIVAAYDVWGADKTIFKSIEELRTALLSFETEQGEIKICKEDVIYQEMSNLIDKLNLYYDNMDFKEMIGTTIYSRPEQRQKREQRCIEIYGKLI